VQYWFRPGEAGEAIDSSVLLQILKREEGWERWRDAISGAASEGPLLICPVVFAECSMGFAIGAEA